ncbi:MAG: hypothetical protein QHC90_30305 [Shinella sp.]|nr:hypothetical protein [Shinella sp.]
MRPPFHLHAPAPAPRLQSGRQSKQHRQDKDRNETGPVWFACRELGIRLGAVLLLAGLIQQFLTWTTP